MCVVLGLASTQNSYFKRFFFFLRNSLFMHISGFVPLSLSLIWRLWCCFYSSIDSVFWLIHSENCMHVFCWLNHFSHKYIVWNRHAFKFNAYGFVHIFSTQDFVVVCLSFFFFTVVVAVVIGLCDVRACETNFQIAIKKTVGDFEDRYKI